MDKGRDKARLTMSWWWLKLMSIWKFNMIFSLLINFFKFSKFFKEMEVYFFLKKGEIGRWGKCIITHIPLGVFFLIYLFIYLFASNSASSLWVIVGSQVSKIGSQSATATPSRNTNPTKPTSAKALFSTQRAPSRVHQVWEESPSSWGLIYGDLHGLGHSEKWNPGQQSIHIFPFFSSLSTKGYL